MTRACLAGLGPVALLFFVGCSADTTEDVGADEASIIGGTVTTEAPEVGKVDFSWGEWCTATLITPRVAITAAHCVGWNSADITGSYGSFAIEQTNGSTTRYRVDRYRAFPRDGLGAPDVALIRLATAVPANIATPARLATSKPVSGTGLTIFGYGCNDDWTHQTGGGVKRKWSYNYGDTFHDRLCPGDSGGPVRIRSTNEVLLINSGWVSNWLGTKHDVFGEIPQYISQITAQEQAWSAADPTSGLRGEYYDVQDLTGSPKVTRVDATVNFDWGSGTPNNVVESDTFSVRWSGKLVPTTTESYTLEAYTDDGVRVWVDNQLVIDNWVAHSPASSTATVSLTAGRQHALKVEYFEKGGGAVAKLYWASASQGRQIIPSSALKP